MPAVPGATQAIAVAPHIVAFAQPVAAAASPAKSLASSAKDEHKCPIPSVLTESETAVVAPSFKACGGTETVEYEKFGYYFSALRTQHRNRLQDPRRRGKGPKAQTNVLPLVRTSGSSEVFHVNKV